MARFRFYVNLSTTVDIECDDAETAQEMIEGAIDGHFANFGALPNGDPVVAKAFVEGDATLIEIDGEAA